MQTSFQSSLPRPDRLSSPFAPSLSEIQPLSPIPANDKTVYTFKKHDSRLVIPSMKPYHTKKQSVSSPNSLPALASPVKAIGTFSGKKFNYDEKFKAKESLTSSGRKKIL